MAGDWIKFEIGTSDKSEVWAIAQALTIDPDAVVGKLLRVWAWFDQHTEEGNAPIVTKMLLDRIVGVTGFCNSVIAAGWMTESESEISLTNFDRHNGKTAKNRATTAKRVASFKKGKKESNDEGNGVGVTSPLPKEEKRREDIDINKNTSEGSEKTPKKPKEKKSEPELNFSSWPEQPDQQILKDWIAMRKGKKGSFSQTVIDSFGEEFQKAASFGHSVDDCLKTALMGNWTGFKFEWMQNQTSKLGSAALPPQTQFLTAREKTAQRNAEIFDINRARDF